MNMERSRQANIEKILTRLMHEGHLLSAIVASRDGLPLAMVGRAKAVTIAAVAAAMKDLAERAHQDLTEITTRDDRGRRIVSRYFWVGEDLLLLAVELPVNRPYRRLTKRAIRAIQQVWSD